MPNIGVVTPTTEIEASYDTAVQTDLNTLIAPNVAMPVLYAGQQVDLDTVVITEKTVKPKRSSFWFRVKKNVRRVLCCGCA